MFPHSLAESQYSVLTVERLLLLSACFHLACGKPLEHYRIGLYDYQYVLSFAVLAAAVYVGEQDMQFRSGVARPQHGRHRYVPGTLLPLDKSEYSISNSTDGGRGFNPHFLQVACSIAGAGHMLISSVHSACLEFYGYCGMRVNASVKKEVCASSCLFRLDPSCDLTNVPPPPHLFLPAC